ncbi:hypothetical protein VN24_19020 [Paenibacillus beijingensis]|uniref:Thioesterase domain-containing protein n=2 Tax=Paenibacillus beijingensis TaxID=1126833 RepID=A0A0D5NLR9_9BACL|nr:hypothetical protein VN24_19020 [Paenibacillus beijingensis]
MPGNISIIPIELAGKGLRHDEPNYESFEQMVDDVYGIIKKYIDDSPVAFFGHSIGALILYELCYRYNLDYIKPKKMIFSGASVPHLYKIRIYISYRMKIFLNILFLWEVFHKNY